MNQFNTGTNLYPSPIFCFQALGSAQGAAFQRQNFGNVGDPGVAMFNVPWILKFRRILDLSGIDCYDAVDDPI